MSYADLPSLLVEIPREALAAKDAEIAKLRAEADSEKQRASDWSAAAVTQRKRAEDAEAALAAARAAIDGEREAHSRLISAAETISRCESALSADAVQGHLRMSAVTKIQSDKEESLSEIRQLLARRAAEAKGLKS